MERLEFARKTLLLDSGAVILGMSGSSSSTFASVPKTMERINDAKKVFREKGACSNTFCFLLNREFGNNDINYERSTDLLVGGMALSGHQCGMLWGSTLAVGTEMYHRCGNSQDVIGKTIGASQHVLNAFAKCAGSADCRVITGCDFRSKWDTMRYMVKVIVGGMNNSGCFNLAEKWMPEAIAAANEGMNLKPYFTKPAMSCASEVVRKMGGTEKEIVLVSGYAGGLALSGNACGALAASIWMNMLKWHRNNPDKKPKYFNNPVVKRVMKSYYNETGNEILCSKVCKRTFSTIDEHTDFVMQGGCGKLIETLAKA